MLSRPLRSRRRHEWTGGKAVTFIVTLAATRCVTLAARAAGMSRKSAYALKARDPAFAHAWESALNARRQGGKVEEVEAPPVSIIEGNTCTRAALSTESTSPGRSGRRREEVARDLYFARLGAKTGCNLSPALQGGDGDRYPRHQGRTSWPA